MHLYLTDTIIVAVVGVLLGVAVIVVIIIVVLLIHLCSSSKKRTCRLPWTHFAVYDVICYMLFVTLAVTMNKQHDDGAKQEAPRKATSEASTAVLNQGRFRHF